MPASSMETRIIDPVGYPMAWGPSFQIAPACSSSVDPTTRVVALHPFPVEDGRWKSSIAAGRFTPPGWNEPVVGWHDIPKRPDP